jgi:tRNA G26 N,N-dimethylase Trm1
MAPKKPHLFETIDSALPFILNEGAAKINFPNGKVFYNPVQQFNRDLSIAAIRTYFKNNLQIKV